jgi:hypothetical protein
VQDDSLSSMGRALQQGVEVSLEARQWLLDHAKLDRNVAGAAGVNFLMLLGYVCGGWLMGQSALKAKALLESGATDEAFLKAKLVTARFYCEHLLPRAGACLAAIEAGPESTMALAEDQF